MHDIKCESILLGNNPRGMCYCRERELEKRLVAAEAVAAADGTLHNAIDHWQERAVRAEAKIDALMLEFCPAEMTQAQVNRWMAHQVATDSADSAPGEKP